MQDEARYTCVNTITEDYENTRFVYRGLLLGADNAIGIIESNIPLSEIIASPDGNIKLQEMLSKKNAEVVRDNYYKRIGESLGPIEGHSTHFGRPDFPLGTIVRGENGKFSFSSKSSDDIEVMLAQEREELKKEKRLRDEESVRVDIGGGLVVSDQDCWLEQGDGIQFAGINNAALYYRYSPEDVIRTEDNKYLYIGTAILGQVSNGQIIKGEPFRLEIPFTYKNVALWTDKKNLIQYFLEDKFNGLNFTLGEIFANGNIKRAKEQSNRIIGGITKNNDGECKFVTEIPSSIQEAVQEYMEQQNNRRNNIINLNDFKR